MLDGSPKTHKNSDAGLLGLKHNRQSAKMVSEEPTMFNSQAIVPYGLIDNTSPHLRYKSIGVSNSEVQIDDDIVIGLPQAESKVLTSASTYSMAAKKNKLKSRRNSSEKSKKEMKKTLKASPYLSKRFKDNISEYI